MKRHTLFGIVLSGLPSAWAQASVWGQCGGINWTGSTSCVSGSTCVYQNDWYSQCLPSSTTATSTSKTSSSTSKASSSTSKSSSTSSTSKTSSSTSKASSSTSSAPTASGTSTGKYWFSFGDSYTQTGFTVTGEQPSSSNAFGNPTYPGYTACGSVPNWIDYAATTLNSTLVKVYNHAYGGATIDATLVVPYSSSVLSLGDQVNNFLTYNAPGKTYYPGWSSSNAIFSIWVGINDIGNSYYLSGDRSAFDTTLLNRYFELVTSLYNVGARHFLFLTVPPIERSPLMLAQADSARAAEKVVIADYNSQLASMAASFASSHSGVTTQIFDTQVTVNAMLDNPTAYGLTDATSYGSSTTVAWCNDYHISPPVHLQIAKGVAALIKGTYI
ncbi:carbohydrate esterase family 16 protein [Serendipita vermifera MAFF 305830]|uniref:Carbohydrate esterase family 16 protein n=1 Tax=Serendipita vermifera MAFF 305830 TaxID=933852 RepID=A0A0C2X6P9_SERVB|nr:carbohydrate esterase family 16 protein [Serendipita vermifera MAFF 305830]